MTTCRTSCTSVWSGPSDPARWPALALATCIAATAPGAAQHAADPVAAEPGCVVCHGAHGGASSALNLKLDDVQVWGVESLGEISRSCLRCHASAAVRARQPELAGRASGAGGARLLGSDLSAQHPVGRRSPLGRSFAPPLGGAAPVWRTDAVASVECSACHDSHAPSGAVPQAPAEARICGYCHDIVIGRVGHEALYCSDCHDMHPRVASTGLMRGPETDATCRTCHLTAGGAAPETPGPRRPIAAAHRDEPAPPPGRCTDCHAAHR